MLTWGRVPRLFMDRAAQTFRPWSQVGELLGHRYRAVVVLVVASVLAGLAESGVLALVAQTAEGLVSGASRVTVSAGLFTVHAKVETLLLIGMALAVIRLALAAVVSAGPARIAADMQAELRNETFAAFTRASWREQSRDLEGHLQEILTDQVAAASGGVLQATIVIVTGATFLVLILSALLINVTAALVVVAAAILLFVVLRPLSNWGSRSAEAVSFASLGYAGGLNESVRIAEDMHVFGVGGPQRERMRKLLADVTAPFYHMQLVARLVPGIYQSLLLVLVVGALLALAVSGTGHIASLGAVVLLLIRASSYGQQAQGAQLAVRQALPYLDRVNETRSRYLKAREPSGTRRIKAVEFISFEHVSFDYGRSELVLQDLSFKIERHEAIGVIGPSGAGKSTLVQLLLRLREPNEGIYCVNGLPAREVLDADWSRLVAYVPQEPRLLHASVAENIRFRRPIADSAVEHAAKLAGIHDDIVTWSSGYDTLIGPRADAVSGGQKQRISLARALAAEPELLVLDEPTSSLDPRSEHAIQRSLAELRSQLTLVVIAHRMTTLGVCDRVMVIVGGEIEAFDPIERLHMTSPYYHSVATIGQEMARTPTGRPRASSVAPRR